jgi:hypothetical protein
MGLGGSRPPADIRHVHALPKVHVSLPKQAHDLLCTASLLHQRTLSSPRRDTRILSQDLDQDLGRGSIRITPPFRLPLLLHLAKGTLAAINSTVAVMTLVTAEALRTHPEPAHIADPPDPISRQPSSAVLARYIHLQLSTRLQRIKAGGPDRNLGSCCGWAQPLQEALWPARSFFYPELCRSCLAPDSEACPTSCPR